MLKRTHNCEQLRPGQVGTRVVLAGWVHSYRDHGNLVFVDIRDRAGITQLVFNPEIHPEAHTTARTLRCEWVVAVEGLVRDREEEMINPKIPTGTIEIMVEKIEILNTAETPPFNIEDAEKASEELRLEYRYVDLRRPSMQNMLDIRHRVIKTARDYFDSLGFREIETPMLAKSTPEGARDFLVPSRLQEEGFYALPQSPQLFKQILMVGGIDKYFQIVRCFRDEDPRADRQAEFTQIDVEMSFVDTDDIICVHEKLVANIWDEALSVDVSLPIRRMPYKDAMDKYGCDRPDLRFGLELTDVTDTVSDSSFNVFTSVAKKGGVVKGLCAPGKDVLTKNYIEGPLTAFVGDLGAAGLAWFRVISEEGKLVCNSSITKFFTDQQLSELIGAFGAKEGDVLLFVADHEKKVNKCLSALRGRLGKELELYDNKTFEFVWIMDFPLFECEEDQQKLSSMHHPFTSPVPGDMDRLESEPANIISQAYDIVVNGVEIGGGSIRIHNPEIQKKVFKLLKLSDKQIKERFGFFLRALSYGAPPHGGIALGLDRLIMIMTGTDNIRDVIAFPKTKKGQCLLSDAPGPVDQKQLDELNLRTQRHSHSPETEQQAEDD